MDENHPIWRKYEKTRFELIPKFDQLASPLKQGNKASSW